MDQACLNHKQFQYICLPPYHLKYSGSLGHRSATWVNIHPGVNLAEIRGEFEFWGKSVTKRGLLKKFYNFSDKRWTLEISFNFYTNKNQTKSHFFQKLHKSHFLKLKLTF